MSNFDKLVKAIKKGDSQKFAEILQDPNIDVNQLDQKSGKSLIQMTIENRDQTIFQILLKCNKVNFENSSADGEYPLQTAILLNEPYFVNKLLEENINPRKKNLEGETAIQIAVMNQTNSQILKKMLLNNFDVNQKVNRYGCLLNLAIAYKQSQNFFLLISEPTVKIATRDEDENSCLILAVINKNGEIVRAILEKISEDLNEMETQFFINAQNKDGNTALHLAYINDLQNIFGIIQKYGEKMRIDKSIRNRKGLNIDDIIKKRQKDRIIEKEAQQNRILQRKIKNKQKQEEKTRIKEVEERKRNQEKKLKKEAEKAQIEFMQSKKKQTFNKSAWIMAIAFVIAIGVMYLAIVNAIQKQNMLKQ